MSVAKILTEESIQGKARMAGGAKAEPISIAREGNENFMKWVSAHEKDVKEILCTSGKFSRESFCDLRHRTRLAGSFSWGGVAL